MVVTRDGMGKHAARSARKTVSRKGSSLCSVIRIMGPVSLDVEKDIMEIVVMNRARRNV